jgi:hypothetical protein
MKRTVKVNKGGIGKLEDYTIASDCKIWYYVHIQVDQVYSTKIGLIPLK